MKSLRLHFIFLVIATLFLSTIDRTPRSFVELIIGAEYLLKMVPKGTHHYSEFIRPSELKQWATQNNLALRGITGITYHPLKKKFELTDSVDVNYLICFQAVS